MRKSYPHDHSNLGTEIFHTRERVAQPESTLANEIFEEFENHYIRATHKSCEVAPRVGRWLKLQFTQTLEKYLGSNSIFWLVLVHQSIHSHGLRKLSRTATSLREEQGKVSREPASKGCRLTPKVGPTSRQVGPTKKSSWHTISST